MRHYVGILATGLSLVLSPSLASAADNNLTSYVQSLAPAQLYNDNDQAFQMRLSLLDRATSGTRVKIATFTFDYGIVARRLAAHACAATRRGVHVELLADAKSGDRVQTTDAFDGSNEAKAVEELYNLMADCGVQVYVHNEDTHFVTFFGWRLPNIFGTDDGSSISPFTLLDKIGAVKTRLVSVVEPILKKMGVASTPAAILDDLQDIAVAINLTGPATIFTGPAPAKVAEAYHKILTDPFLKEMDASKMRTFVTALEQALQNDTGPGGLAEIYRNLRVYNRLNHRKIFLIRDDSGAGCAIIGGRNLGDHYLTTRPDSYHDGDVLLCSNLKSGIGDYLDEVEQSFDELKTDTSDWELNSPNSNHIRLVRPIHDYAYQFIKPAEITVTTNVQIPMPSGTELKNVNEPHLLKSAWHPADDKVRMALLRGITQERRSIYIETAYAEFNKSVREALEQAMQRGVAVTIITNGIFISDGASKLIGLWMAPWYERMRKTYPKLFSLVEATVAYGRMIHFKGAAFQCQKDFSGTYYRRYLIGSHNFHPRSGYSDKENSLTWTEPTTAACADANTALPSDDMQALRSQYYQALRKVSPVPLLEIYIKASDPSTPHYPGVQWEIYRAGNSGIAPVRDFANIVDAALFHMDAAGKNKLFWYPNELEKFIDLMEQGGLRDLIGVLL